MSPADFTSELLCLGVDVLICGVIYKLYKNIQENAVAVKEAPAYLINKDLERVVQEAAGSTLPYVAIRGDVRALRQPIYSQHGGKVAGVVQRLILKEHKTKWTWGTRFWSDTTREIHNVANSVPFVIRGSGKSVEVIDALKGDILDLSTIHNTFEPTQQSLKDMLMGFFLGEHSKGFQQIETMLVEGTVITGIGELVWRHGGLQLQAPSDGSSKFYLTQMSQHSLVKKLESDGRMLKFFLGLFGAVGVFVMVMIGKKWFKEYKEHQLIEKERRNYENIRQERMRRQRQRTRSEQTGDATGNSANESSGAELTCVVCLSNPREVMIQNCNHVCCCADCVFELNPRVCPICRNVITETCPIYIS